MHDNLTLGSLKIIYAGKQFGNLDSRFSPADVIEKQHKKIENLVLAKYYIIIKAAGSDQIVDLSKSKLESGWNVIRADAVITDNDDVCLNLFPADCIPMVIYSIKSNLRALVHIGYKGAEIGIQIKVLKYLLEEKNQNLTDLRFYLGPSITKASYFFPDINQEQKDSTSWKPFIEYRNGNYHIDLQGFVISELQKAGVRPQQITDSQIDTFTENYFSHRRSVLAGDPEGRNLFAVWFDS